MRNETGRVFVVVEGGYVTNVEIPGLDLTHTVINFDDAEDEDLAMQMWATFDERDRAYLRKAYPDLCELYFGEAQRAERARTPG